MQRPREISRVIVVVLDGLRPDAIALYGLRHIWCLAQQGASTFTGTTVAPSVTAAAMTSLFTGVPPDIHGLTSERFHIPRPHGPIDPLPRVLASHGLPQSLAPARIDPLFSSPSPIMAGAACVGPITTAITATIVAATA